MKIFFFSACILAHLSLSSQVSIECDYSTYTYEVLGNIYRCDVKNNPNIINPQSAQVTSTFGVHHSQKSNNEVIGFHAFGKNLQFFPKGLEIWFKNIQAIYIMSCKLKEVHQDDLKPFPNLIFLYLFGNLITIIEPGLFDFNPNLEYISIGDNKILHIDANVFDGLTKLWHLHLNAVPCYDKYVCTFGKTQQLIKDLRLKCKDITFMEIEGRMKDIESEAGSLGYHAFNTKVLVVEREFLSSKFSRNSYLKSKLESLKFLNVSSTQTGLQPQKTDITTQTCTNCCQIDQISTLDMKIGNISEILRTLKPFEDEMDSKLSGINSQISDHGTKLNEVQKTQENIETRLTDFEGKTNEKLEEIKQDLAATRHKIAVNFDEKIRGIEKRLMKKFEDILEDKLIKIFEEKLGSIIEGRLSAK